MTFELRTEEEKKASKWNGRRTFRQRGWWGAANERAPRQGRILGVSKEKQASMRSGQRDVLGSDC